MYSMYVKCFYLFTSLMKNVSCPSNLSQVLSPALQPAPAHLGIYGHNPHNQQCCPQCIHHGAEQHDQVETVLQCSRSVDELEVLGNLYIFNWFLFYILYVCFWGVENTVVFIVSKIAQILSKQNWRHEKWHSERGNRCFFLDKKRFVANCTEVSKIYF